MLVRGRSPSDTRIRGEIFTDYYFGEANTANKSDNQHNNAINENLNWGGISGLLQLATTNSGSRPEIQDGPGGKGGGEAGDDEELNTTNKDSTPRRRRTSDEKLPQRDNNVERRGHQDIKRETTIQTDDQIEASSLKV